MFFWRLERERKRTKFSNCPITPAYIAILEVRHVFIIFCDYSFGFLAPGRYFLSNYSDKKKYLSFGCLKCVLFVCYYLVVPSFD